MTKKTTKKEAKQIQIRLTIDPKVLGYYERKAEALGIPTNAYILMILGQKALEETQTKE